MVDRQMARLDVDLYDGFAVDRHPVALLFFQLLVTAVARTVEATTLLPRLVIENADVAVVFTSGDFEAREKLVQFPNVAFEPLSLRRAPVVLNDRPAFSVAASSRGVVLKD